MEIVSCPIVLLEYVLMLCGQIYNGKGEAKGDFPLRGLLPSLQNGFGTIYFKVALPNLKGGHALALVNNAGVVVHFISWKGMLFIVTI
jgi:hypothetical protein